MKNKGLWMGVILATIAIVALIFVMKKTTYTITFALDDNTIIETQKVRENKMSEKPNDPTKEGYVFAGWYLNGERFDFNQEITEDITLVARWTKVSAITYTIKFDSNGGNTIENIEVEKNNIIGTLPRPTKKGYEFKGWYFGTTLVDKNTVVTRDMTLVAKWEKETTTTKKTTTKKTTTTTTTTQPVTTETTKPTTQPVITTKPTTKPVTTTEKVDEISYIKEPVKGSVVGQITLYLTKNGEKVSGTCDIVTTTGETVKDVEIKATGYVTNDGLIESVKNIKIK